MLLSPSVDRVVDIGPGGVWIGREPGPGGLDVPDAHYNVSRRHVWVGRHGEAWVARDASRFGTRVGAAEVGSEHTLRPDDVLELPDDVRVRFELEVPRVRRAPASIWSASSLAGLFGLVGVAALTSAGLVFLLPEAPTQVAETPVVAVVSTPRTDEAGAAAPRLGDPLEEVVRELLTSLRDQPHVGIIPKSFLGSVREQLVGTLRDRTRYCAMQRWRGPLRETLLAAAARRGEPERRVLTYVYLPFVESGYEPEICSPARARGMWQFIARSWNRFASEEIGLRDPRCDWKVATDAAVHHLASNFRDCPADAPLSAIAAYNFKLEKMCSLECSGGLCEGFDFTPFVDRGLVPDETRHYVPRFVAAWLLGEYPDIALQEARRIRPGISLPAACGEQPDVPPPRTCSRGC